jgi:hypothetical protein
MRCRVSRFSGFILIGVTMLALGACAFGRKVDYGGAMALNVPNGSQQIALSVLDHRPYVLSGDKAPSFVGLQRDGYGIPYNVNTTSGGPLADDFSKALAQSLTSRGYKVQEMKPLPSTSTDDAIKQAVGTGADRAVILEVTEWKTDQLQNAALLYGLGLSVYDSHSVALASNSLSGKDSIPSNYLDGAEQIAPAAFRQKMTQLFGKQEVQTAFAAAP